LLAHGRWLSPGTPASSTTKTGRHDIADILLKVALNTKTSINQWNCKLVLVKIYLIYFKQQSIKLKLFKDCKYANYLFYITHNVLQSTWKCILKYFKPITWIRHSLQANIASTHRHVHVRIVVLGPFLHYSWLFSLFFNSTYPVNYIAKEIFWAEIYRGRLFFRAEIYRGRLFFRADRSLGAKQEGLAIVHFLNKLIVSCKEAVRFPF